jgi:hypothetical protein
VVPNDYNELQHYCPRACLLTLSIVIYNSYLEFDFGSNSISDHNRIIFGACIITRYPDAELPYTGKGFRGTGFLEQQFAGGAHMMAGEKSSGSKNSNPKSKENN